MNTGELQTFTLYWLSGEREVVTGEDIADAMARASCCDGATSAIQFYSRGENDEYEWNTEWRSWKRR